MPHSQDHKEYAYKIFSTYGDWKFEKIRGNCVGRTTTTTTRTTTSRGTHPRAQNGNFLRVITFEPSGILTCGLREGCLVGPGKRHAYRICPVPPWKRPKNLGENGPRSRDIYSTLAPRMPKCGRGGTRFRGCWIGLFHHGRFFEKSI